MVDIEEKKQPPQDPPGVAILNQDEYNRKVNSDVEEALQQSNIIYDPSVGGAPEKERKLFFNLNNDIDPKINGDNMGISLPA